MQTAVLLLALVGCVFSTDHFSYGRQQQTNYGSSPSYGNTQGYTTTPNAANHATTNPAGKPAAPTTPAKPTYADIMCISKGQCKSGIDTAQTVLYKQKEEIVKLMKLGVHNDIAKEVIPLPYDVRMSVLDMFNKERKGGIPTEQTGGAFTANFDFAFESLFQKPETLMANALGIAVKNQNYVSMVEILFSVSKKGVAEILKEYKTIKSNEFFEDFLSANSDTTYLPPNFYKLKNLIEKKVKIDATKDSEESKPVDMEKAKKDAALIYQKLDDNDCVEDILQKLFLEDSPEQMKALMNLDFNCGDKMGDPDEAMNFTKLMYEKYPFETVRKVYITIGSIFKNPHLYYLRKVWDNVRRSSTEKYHMCSYTEVSLILIGRAEIDLGSIVEANPKMTEEIIKKLSVSKAVALFDPTKIHAVLRMFTEQARNRGVSAHSTPPAATGYGHQAADNGSGYGTGDSYRRAANPPAPEYGTGSNYRRADSPPASEYGTGNNYGRAGGTANPGFGTERGYGHTETNAGSGYSTTYTPTAATGYGGTVTDYGTNSQGSTYRDDGRGYQQTAPAPSRRYGGYGTYDSG